ncbi:MAG: hypothetical protein R3209_04795, partial [Salinimicrobium sediminis]|nr:hypothetical protein [Salinimicrobium sediminis]
SLLVDGEILKSEIGNLHLNAKTYIGMKKIFFIVIIFLPVLAFGQDRSLTKNTFQSQTELQNHPLLRISADSERNMETILVDDRNFSKSLINFNFVKSYNLSFTEKNTRLFKIIEEKKSVEGSLELEPLLELKWQFLRLN